MPIAALKSHTHPYHIVQHWFSSVLPWKAPVRFSLCTESRDGCREIRIRENAQSAVKEWGVWEQMINKRNDWFIEEGGRSQTLAFMNLMNRFCSFLCLCFILSLQSFLRLHSCTPVSQLKPTPAGRAERWSIFYESIAQPDRQTGDGDVRDGKDRQKLKSSRDKQRTAVPWLFF